MNAFLCALQFLTVIPVKPDRFTAKSMGDSVVFFPVAGLLIGCGAALTAWVVRSWMAYPALTASVCATVSLALVSGGLHLDGLADTFDALGSRKDRQGMLQVMRDPRIGSLGAVAVACALMVKSGALYGYAGNDMIRALIFIPVVSRWACVFAMAMFPTAREDGRAVAFKGALTARSVRWATLVAAIGAAFIAGTAGLILMACVGVAALLIGAHFARKFGGLTGDTIGAVCEMTEVMIALCMLPLDKLI